MTQTIHTPAFQNLIKDFDSFVKVKNYKSGKGKNYKSTVTQFLVWLEQKGINKIKSVTSKESVAYFEYLSTRPKLRGTGTLADKTIKFHSFTLGLFVLNLLENKEIENGFFIPCHGGATEKPRDILTVDEIKTVYRHCQNHQEKALLSVAYGCGLRRSEIEALDTRDVQLSSGMIIVRKGKNGKRREVPMSNTVVEDLKRYLMEERYQMFIGKKELVEALFVNIKGERIKGDQLNVMLKKMIDQTNQYELIKKDITLHCMRHSIASHLADNGAGIEFVRRFLGHAEINTTYLYAIKNKKRKTLVMF